jgi:DNA-directed RNA polymerase specialized sigma24 family protein
LRHGAAHHIEPLDPDAVVQLPPDLDLVALDEALQRLELEDPAKAELVKLRYFAGLTLVEAAGVLGISRATADRRWSFARAWLFHEVSKGDHPATGTSPESYMESNGAG